jgi:hypothetical protein
MDFTTFDQAADQLPVITGLFSIWLGEQRHKKSVKAEDFKAWLEEHRFETILTALDENKAMFDYLSEFIELNTDHLARKIDEVKELQLIMAKHMMAVSSRPTPRVKLSEQAKSILLQLIQLGDSTITSFGAIEEGHVLLAGGGRITYTQERHVEEDLESLRQAGYLRRQTRFGIDIYNITRAGEDTGQRWLDEFS